MPPHSTLCPSLPVFLKPSTSPARSHTAKWTMQGSMRALLPWSITPAREAAPVVPGGCLSIRRTSRSPMPEGHPRYRTFEKHSITMAKRKTSTPSVAAEPGATYTRTAATKRPAANPRPVDEWIREGSKPLSMQRFRAIARKVPFPLERWGAVLHVPSARWKQRLAKREQLAPLEADRVLLVEELYRRGEEVFGNKEDFQRWMELDHLLLGKAPMAYLVSSKGIEQVLDELVAIEHGLPA